MHRRLGERGPPDHCEVEPVTLRRLCHPPCPQHRIKLARRPIPGALALALRPHTYRRDDPTGLIWRGDPRGHTSTVGGGGEVLGSPALAGGHARHGSRHAAARRPAEPCRLNRRGHHRRQPVPDGLHRPDQGRVMTGDALNGGGARTRIGKALRQGGSLFQCPKFMSK